MKLFGSIFTGVGILLLCVSIGTFIGTRNFMNTAETIVGVIDEIESYTTTDSDGDRVNRHNVYVDYIYNGISYDNQLLSEYSSSMREGADIELLIDPKNPSDVRTKSMSYFSTILTAFMGLIFGGIGVNFVTIEIKADLKDKKAKENGKRIIAEIVEVEYDYSFKVNGEPAKVLICKYIDDYSGNEYIYRSRRSMKFNQSFVGKKIDVYIDKETGHEFVDFKSIL